MRIRSSLLPNLLLPLFVALAAGACGPLTPEEAEASRKDIRTGGVSQLSGRIEKLSTDSLLIEGRPIELTEQTLIRGELAVGKSVEMKLLTLDDGTLQAQEVTLSFVEDEQGFEAELFGTVEEIHSDAWIVDSQLIILAPGTEIKDDIQLGDRVKIHASRNSAGDFVAREIELALEDAPEDAARASREVEFTGFVEEISDVSWTIDGRIVLLTSGTEIEGPISIGDPVKVHALRSDADRLLAEEIELADAHDLKDDDEHDDLDDDSDGDHAIEGDGDEVEDDHHSEDDDD